MLPDSIIIAQYLHGGTYSLRKFFNTHFPILFQKLFGPFLGAPGALAHYFRIPLLPLRIPIFFPTFRPFIPISTAAPTHYVSFPIHTFPIIFQIYFQNFFGPFSGAPGLLPLFSNSPSPATYPHIFSDVSTFFSLPYSRD